MRRASHAAEANGFAAPPVGDTAGFVVQEWLGRSRSSSPRATTLEVALATYQAQLQRRTVLSGPVLPVDLRV